MRLILPFWALFVLGGLFWAIEERFAALPGQPRWREDSRTDLLYWLFLPFVTKTVRRGAAIVAVLVVAGLTRTPPELGAGVHPFVEGSWVDAQPILLQVVLLVLAADFVGYWIHRLFHRGQLWRLHAVHHSSTQLDWLASVRVHPLNDALGGILRAVPLVLLGFDPLVVAGLMPLFGLHGLLLHANVPWAFGPLRYLISSPCFHRWHHASLEQLPSAHQARAGVNFAGLFPIFDLMFGTFHMPRGVQPREFGVREAVPAGLWAQLVWPFRRGARAHLSGGRRRP